MKLNLKINLGHFLGKAVSFVADLFTTRDKAHEAGAAAEALLTPAIKNYVGAYESRLFAQLDTAAAAAKTGDNRSIDSLRSLAKAAIGRIGLPVEAVAYLSAVIDAQAAPAVDRLADADIDKFVASIKALIQSLE